MKCGNEAYIRVAAERGGHDMVCAHCFGARGPGAGRKGGTREIEKTIPPLNPDPEIHRT
ncbi:MAG: hypothetical protein HYX56_02490 [Chloroflexi bacterium]|nr:hypothetical protein [Chloroflexota bacterium]